ncbi:hypothetical protein CONCODRAFT_79295 [Conidiobolus coronatus NRRL 28638]|uniref:SH3 domain-containing protein n=1 Tax=Conidiobolus coronatus (strain ATCC 28846 / CBS 209.66 / NRRL 28638) TaxID=796925 RepID=A0A137P370_CONC2|nr:hypothetical protein CONCODRAFT_79295 [Conidiobolus coronatus NRRL 28638]|eukprot:KXN69462.1 hypothetical protein CONCODRAFT_79295 [Conidiobolus coronatus NRRL 28638]
MKPPFLNSSLFSKSKTPTSSSPYSSAPTTPPSATLQSQPFSSNLAFKPDSLLTVSYPTIYIAICDHITDDPTLLSFKQGDSIKVMNKLPSGWWEGHLVENPYDSSLGIAPGQPMGLPTEFVAKNGFFPGKFVQKFEEGDGYGESAPSLKV